MDDADRMGTLGSEPPGRSIQLGTASRAATPADTLGLGRV
jgi:hypothetical protein